MMPEPQPTPELLRGRVLFLDDDRDRTESFLRACPQAVCVATAQECMERLAEDWDAIHLDHDLGGEVYVDSAREDCGMEVVRCIAKSRPEHLRRTLFVVHSYNICAAVSMVESLIGAGYKCEYAPFQY